MKNKGFTIFFAMLVSSLALAIGLSIFDITIRELDLSATVKQSIYASYAADTGAECALYWDLNCPLGSCQNKSAFATSSASVNLPSSGLTCNGIDITTSAWSVTQAANAATTSFQITFDTQLYCVDVIVAKVGNPAQTNITAHGYNTCVGGVLQLERALQVLY